METLLQDLRYGIRMLAKSRSFTIVAVVTLALGIGANSSIFSLVNTVLLKPFSFKEPDRIVALSERRDSSQDTNIPVSGHEFVAWRDGAHSFDSMALFAGDAFALTGSGQPEKVNAARVSSDFFAVAGVPPVLGRTFLEGEDQTGANRIAMLSEGLWKRRFGADPDIAGKAIKLNDQSFTVVGVMPALDLMPDILVPIDLANEKIKVGNHSNNVIGRLKPGITIAQAQTELSQIALQLEQQYPEANVGHRVVVLSLQDAVVGTNVHWALVVLLGAVGFVLLIACANVANLLLTRAASRRKEIAIRTALGAPRLRLIRQLLTESCLLAAMGGGLGLLLSLWMVDLLSGITAVSIPRLSQVRIDGRVLAVTLGLSLLTGIVTGLLPALRSSRQSLSPSLTDGTRASAGPGRRRIGSILVVVKVALALVLLAGSGLMLKSFVRLIHVDPGFDPNNVLRADIDLPQPRYPKAEPKISFYEQLIERVRSLPGVELAGATSNTPLGGTENWAMTSIEGRPAPPPGQEAYASLRGVTKDYFRTMRIPLKSGRFFTDGDARIALPLIRLLPQQPYPEHFNEPQPSPAIIINETMARLYWPGDDPLGKRLRIIESPWLTIVGVVGDIRHTSLNLKPNPEMYLSHLQEPQGSMSLMIRTTGDPLSLAAAVREQVNALDSEQPLTINTMEQIFSRSVGGQRFTAVLLTSFGAIALGLAMLGVFGVINFAVAQRTREIGVRIALGAQPRDILKLIVAHGLVLALAGVAIGIGSAIALTRLISDLLFDVSPTDAATFVVVSSLLIAVGALASYIPARRAMKVNPMVVLRCE